MSYRGTPKDLLYTDGYIARMIGPLDAERYFKHLPWCGDCPLHLIILPGHSIIVRPAVKHAQPSTDIDNRHELLLDYLLHDYGTVVPQRFFKFSLNYPVLVQNMPIFFVHNKNGMLGLPLAHAAAGKCKVLDGRAPTPIRKGHTTRLHIRWPGYKDWTGHITLNHPNHTQARDTISLNVLAKRVARVVYRFLRIFVRQQCWRPDWRIGQCGITRNDIILIGLIQVREGGWQPILQLNRYIF